jgi:hypothetical protein
MNTHAGDTFILGFQTVTDADASQIAGDDIMGDVSTSNFRLTSGTAVLQGVLSLANNIGFASVGSLPPSHGLRKSKPNIWSLNERDFIPANPAPISSHPSIPSTSE